MDLVSACDCKHAAVRSHAHAQESEDIELAVVWFGRFVLGYCIRSIDAQARLDHNHNWRIEDRSPRVPISGSPRPTEAFCEWKRLAFPAAIGRRTRLIDLCGLCVAKSSAGFTESDQLPLDSVWRMWSWLCSPPAGRARPEPFMLLSCYGAERAERSVRK